MASVAAWREQQASSPAGGSTEDEDRLDDNASSEGAGLKRSYDSQDMRGSDEPRRKRLVTTPHRESPVIVSLRKSDSHTIGRQMVLLLVAQV